MDSASCRHSSLIIHRSSFRSGVSLMEVLVSIGVIMFGLLGVAAILPLGSRNMAEIAKSDNAAACGASALRNIRAWQVLNPNNWRQPDFSSANPPTTFATLSTPVISGLRLPFGESFAIDPLLVARAGRTIAAPGANANDPQPHLFPYDPSTPTRSYWNALAMRRVSLPLQSTPLNWTHHEAFYDRFFRWRDDVDFHLLTGLTETERPRQMFLCDDGMGRVLPRLPTDTSTAWPYTAQIQGDYSWMAIVTPAFNEAAWNWSAGADSSLYAAYRTQYLLQIVVFHKRDLDVPADYLATEEAPPERTVTANILTDGYGGGDVSLTVPTAGSYSNYLTIRKNQWIMLCGRMVVEDPGNPANTTMMRVYQWYRVVSPGEQPTVSGANWIRYVTLAGPDWKLAWCRNTDEAAAVIVDGVIGVYTMPFEIDRDLQVKFIWP